MVFPLRMSELWIGLGSTDVTVEEEYTLQVDAKNYFLL